MSRPEVDSILTSTTGPRKHHGDGRRLSCAPCNGATAPHSRSSSAKEQAVIEGPSWVMAPESIMIRESSVMKEPVVSSPSRTHRVSSRRRISYRLDSSFVIPCPVLLPQSTLCHQALAFPCSARTACEISSPKILACIRSPVRSHHHTVIRRRCPNNMSLRRRCRENIRPVPNRRCCRQGTQSARHYRLSDNQRLLCL